jgi:stage II sporulation protein M
MYYIIKLEEGKDLEISSEGKLIREHYKAIKSLMWLFLGFVLAFSLAYVIFQDHVAYNFNAQVKVFCEINNPHNYDYCIKNAGLNLVTGNAVGGSVIMGIFSNNIYVLIFTIVFSLLFGAGAIFILSWNASVIAVAIGIFSKASITNIPLGLARYMIHGIPEIGAYFCGAIAGGIISAAVIRKDLKGDNLWKILEDSLSLVIIAIIILFLAAIVEVFVTPKIFG